MIVIFTEEVSMKATLETLAARYFPRLVAGKNWFVIPFNGKSDLEKGFPDRMRKWNYGNPFFVILRDADGGDCRRIKDRLLALASSAAGKRYQVRIVCQELESWFFGDSQAVLQAYPRCAFSHQSARYRNPDLLTRPSKALADLTGECGKVSRAKAISRHLIPEANRSHSFKVFYKTLHEVAARVS